MNMRGAFLVWPVRSVDTYLRVSGQNLEGMIDLLLSNTTSHIKKVGWFAIIQLHDVHRCHGESGSIDQTTDVTVHSDVIEVILSGLLLARVSLRLVIQSENVGLPKLGIVVEVDFCIETNH